MALVLVPEDVEAVLDELGMGVGRTTDDEVWSLCPAHYERLGKQDTSPTNFSVNMDSGMCYCFSCGYGDTLTNMVARYFFSNDAWAASGWLRDRGATLVDAIDRIDRKVKKSHVEAGLIDGTDPDFKFVLFSEPPPLALDKRNLTAEACDRFKVRWDEGKAHWIIPFIAADGRVKGWQRKWDGGFDNEPAKVRKREFLFGVHNLSASRGILVESPLDAVRLATAGYEGGLATYGVEISDEQIALLLKSVDSLVLALDNDAAGHRVTRELIERLGRRMPVRVFNYEGSRAKDPGDMSNEDIDYSMDTAKSTLLMPRGH